MLKAFKLGAREYLKKPFDGAELMTRSVETILRLTREGCRQRIAMIGDGSDPAILAVPDSLPERLSRTLQYMGEHIGRAGAPGRPGAGSMSERTTSAGCSRDIWG